jgi:hypothetical protein
MINVPDIGRGRSLGPVGNGVRLEEGVRESLAPQKARKISSQRSARKEATLRRKKKEGQVRRDEEGPAQTE